MNLEDRLRGGCVYRTPRWNGDTFTDITSGRIDEEATDALLAEAADEISRLRNLFADKTVHYRNLAIDLGATEMQMVDDYDRELCRRWDEPGFAGDDRETRFEWYDHSELWEEIDQLRAERAYFAGNLNVALAALDQYQVIASDIRAIDERVRRIIAGGPYVAGGADERAT